MSVRTRAANVLLSCPHLSGTGGVQLVIRDLVHHLEENGRHVHFIDASPLARLRLEEGTNGLGRHSFYCPMPAVVKDSSLLSVLVFLACWPVPLVHIARVMTQKRIDVINGHYAAPYYIHLVIAARLLRVPFVLSVHGADIDAYAGETWAYRWFLRLVMRGAHRIVACSAAMARQTSEVFPTVRDKVTYVHNGLSPADYPQAPVAPALPHPFLLCVCRHVHKKGVDTLLSAFAIASREVPALSLVLVGSGPLLDAHRALARTLGIEPRVHFIGDVAHTDVPAFLAASTLCVVPSRAEPFGLVILEAALYQKAIVGTRVGGIPEILTDGIDGLLVSPDDPTAMAARIVRLLRDPELRETLGLRARQTLLTRFLWKDRIQDYIAIFEGSSGPRVRNLTGTRVPHLGDAEAGGASAGANAG